MNLESDRRNKIIKYLEYHGIPNEITKGYILPYVESIYIDSDVPLEIPKTQLIVTGPIDILKQNTINLTLPTNKMVIIDKLLLHVVKYGRNTEYGRSPVLRTRIKDNNNMNVYGHITEPFRLANKVILPLEYKEPYCIWTSTNGYKIKLKITNKDEINECICKLIFRLLIIDV